MSLPHPAHLLCCNLPRRADSAPRSLVLLASEGLECERPAFVALHRTLVSLASEVSDGSFVCGSMVSSSGFVCLFLFHIHIDADSSVLPALSITVRRSFPVTPNIFSALNVYWPGNPRQPISTRKHQVFQPLSLHLSTNSVYLSIFCSWASSILSSNATVSSMITHTSLSFEDMTMSGRRFVGAIYSGKRNCLFMYTSSVQQMNKPFKYRFRNLKCPIIVRKP